MRNLKRNTQGDGGKRKCWLGRSDKWEEEGEEEGKEEERAVRMGGFLAASNWGRGERSSARRRSTWNWTPSWLVSSPDAAASSNVSSGVVFQRK